jgi:hypothetical protein
MVTTQKRLQRQALKLSIAAAAFACFGAVVVAAPMTLSKTSIAGVSAPITATKLVPLGSGPAITLARADQGDAEDCVRVTKMTGPDGKVYPTMGMVCGGQ